MKLTPLQLGRLAEHIEQNLKDFPPSPPATEDFEADPLEPDEIPMEPWEKAIKAVIDADPVLPQYGDPVLEKAMDILLDYYKP